MTICDFESEESCRDFFSKIRWPEGFVCPECHGKEFRRRSKRSLYVCKKCGKETSLTANTLFHGARIGLRKLLKIFFDIANGNPKSAAATAKELEISQSVAWEWQSRARRILSNIAVDAEDFGCSVLASILFRRSNETPAVEMTQTEEENIGSTEAPSQCLEPVEQPHFSAIEFIANIFQGISRKHAMPYAHLFNYIHAGAGDLVELLQMCIAHAPIKRAELVATFSPPIIRLIPTAVLALAREPTRAKINRHEAL